MFITKKKTKKEIHDDYIAYQLSNPLLTTEIWSRGGGTFSYQAYILFKYKEDKHASFPRKDDSWYRLSNDSFKYTLISSSDSNITNTIGPPYGEATLFKSLACKNEQDCINQIITFLEKSEYSKFKTQKEYEKYVRNQ